MSPFWNLRFASENNNIYIKNFRLDNDLTFAPFRSVILSWVRRCCGTIDLEPLLLEPQSFDTIIISQDKNTMAIECTFEANHLACASNDNISKILL